MVGFPQIQFREVPGLLECGKGRGDERNGVAILHLDLVETPVVNTWVKWTVLLPHKEETGACEWRGGTDQTGRQALPNVLLHGKALGCGEREKRRPLGGLVPGSRLISQSYDRWGGREVARFLLNTSPKSWYSTGTDDRSGGVTVLSWGGGRGPAADWRQEVWHLGIQPMMRPWLQSTWGLCLRNHGLPSTSGTRGDFITKRTISSWWLPEMRILTRCVAQWTSSNGTPVRVQGRNGLARGTEGMSKRLTRLGQMGLGGRRGRVVGKAHQDPLTHWRALSFNGQSERRCPAPPQYRHRWLSRRRCCSATENLVRPICMGSVAGISKARDGTWPRVQDPSRNLSGSRRRWETSILRVKSTRTSRETGRSQVLCSSSSRSDSPLE